MNVSEMIYNQKRKVAVPVRTPSEPLRQGMDAQKQDEELFSQTDKRRRSLHLILRSDGI